MGPSMNSRGAGWQRSNPGRVSYCLETGGLVKARMSFFAVTTDCANTVMTIERTRVIRRKMRVTMLQNRQHSDQELAAKQAKIRMVED